MRQVIDQEKAATVDSVVILRSGADGIICILRVRGNSMQQKHAKHLKIKESRASRLGPIIDFEGWRDQIMMEIECTVEIQKNNCEIFSRQSHQSL